MHLLVSEQYIDSTMHGATIKVINVSVFKSTDVSEIDSVSLIRVLIRLDNPYQHGVVLGLA